MVQRQAQIAKITRPTLPAVVPRERLFRLLDEKPHSQVTWISGPPGSGKTTLVAGYLESRELPCIWYQVDAGDSDIATFFHYLSLAAKKAAPRTRKPLPPLTPEYLLDVPTFSRRYFENLFSRLRPPFYMVFDNYQEVQSESPFHETLRAGLSAMPEGVRAVIISRAGPPPAYAKMLAGDTMDVIGWDELRLTAEESRSIALLHGDGGQRNELIGWMHDKTDGWVAGLILITKALKRDAGDVEAVLTLTPENIFDYFANELFDKRTDEATKEFLIKTAILPRMTPLLAEQLTGNRDAGRILSELNRRNYFTEKREFGGPAYQYHYHSLFREFLLTRAKEILGREDLLDIRIQAASLLEQTGQLEDAAELCLEAQAWETLIRLILSHAPALMNQGRRATLASWLVALPQETSSQDPWLLYWSGACHVPYCPRESQGRFEKAFLLFNKRKESVGSFLSWAGIVNCIAYAMEDMTQFDHWISALDSLLNTYGGFPSKEVEGWAASAMVRALIMRQPSHRDFDSWKSRALLHEETKIHTLFHLAYYYTYRGDFPHADQMRAALYQVAGAPGASPLGLILAKLIDVIIYILIGPAADRDHLHRCVRSACEGLEISERSGVHIMDFMLQGNAAIASRAIGDLTSARLFLQKMSISVERQPAWNRGMYAFAHASEALAAGDPDRALIHAEASLRYCLQVGVPMSIVWSYYVSALARHERGDVDFARVLLEKGFRAARVLNSTLTTYEYLFLKAYFDLCAGKKKAAFAGLKRALTIGRERGICSIYTLPLPKMMLSLCVGALESGIEVEHVRRLIRSRHVWPDEPPFNIETWPWPVKVYTLGRFRIDVDEKPLAFHGKAQKKPLDMLKALIAFGGSGVSEEQITGALWPGAEGDHAHRSFEMTLHRLRRMLGRDETVKLHGGHVSLDERFCWTDARAFDQAVQRAETASQDEASAGRKGPGRSGRAAGDGRRRTARRKRPDKTSELFEKAIAFYQGPFLPSDSRQSWSIAMRERLRSRFIRLIGAAGERLEHAEDWAGAADLYEKCLEIDGLAEEFYQRLMHCHRRLGQEAQAVMVYHRCKKALLRNFGITPSSQTEAIYKQVLRARR